MKFLLVDRIEAIEPGKRPDGPSYGRIVTTKALSLAEEYLADHFPAFPVMPGVLMLEALTQSAAWLVRIEQDYAKSMIVLRSARNVRYTNFVQPGNSLRCEVDVVSIEDDTAKFKAAAFVSDKQAVSARLELRCMNLADRDPALARSDEAIIEQMKRTFELIGGPEALGR